MYTRTVHLDMHMAEVLKDRARQEIEFCIRVHGPRKEWRNTMTQEERDKVRGPAMTLSRAAEYFRAHVCSEDIQELLMTGVKRWGATKEEMKQFRSHLPGGIKLVLDTPAPVTDKQKKKRGACNFGLKASDCNIHPITGRVRRKRRRR
jgi:hypothetical protein